MEARLRHKRWLLGCVAVVWGTSLLAAQSTVTRVPLPNSNFPISAAVWAGDTLYVSGMIDSAVAKGQPGDTQTQTVHALEAIKHTLEEQHLTLGDVVMMHAYLAGDPAHGGKMDFAGFMAGYSQYFGTKEQRTSRHAAPCRWRRWPCRGLWWKSK